MIKLFDTEISEASKQYVKTVLDTGLLSEGTLVDLTETTLKKILKTPNVLLVNSGTSALHLALILAGIKSGDEVILPAQTFVATGLAILYCGAKPIFVDIWLDGTINVDDVEQKITSKTRAVIAVDWGGYPADRFSLQNLCNKRGLKLIVDAAHSFGAKSSHNELVGNDDSDFTCFSFQAIKSVTAGDGGAIVCKNANDYERGKRLRWFGIDRKNNLPDDTGERNYNLTEIGYKYHMNNLSAAILSGQLENYETQLLQRRLIALAYDSHLFDISGITLMDYDSISDSSYWLYPILVENRKDLMKKLEASDIESSVVHKGIDRNEIFGGINNSLTMQRRFDNELLHIPIRHNLTNVDILKVISVIQGGW